MDGCVGPALVFFVGTTADDDTINPALSFGDLPHQVIIDSLPSMPSIIWTHVFLFKNHQLQSILLFDSWRLLEESIAACGTFGWVVHQRTSSCIGAGNNQEQWCVFVSRNLENFYCHVWPCPWRNAKLRHLRNFGIHVKTVKKRHHNDPTINKNGKMKQLHTLHIGDYEKGSDRKSVV